MRSRINCKKEEKTVFILRCGDRYAITKRPKTGLLAGLWEFPNVSGCLSAGQALKQMEGWGTHPLHPEKIVEKVHVFTHVEWKMHGIYAECSAMPDVFAWAAEDELDDIYALPTAFRQFREGKN